MAVTNITKEFGKLYFQKIIVGISKLFKLSPDELNMTTFTHIRQKTSTIFNNSTVLRNIAFVVVKVVNKSLT